ncbi:cupredoxin domain-containing protein [Chrysiogenes arsenatis]|uniref:cupredoxin domain-containing protein n=1 Tax=Chrysiogenes arsenatis TaxID=309797 RepID=UPI00041DD4C1|nr:cupredoxin domain-containing protein [Chrysiogenes arsenatis]
MKKMIPFLVAASVALLLTACGNDAKKTQSTSSATPAAAAVTTAAPVTQETVKEEPAPAGAEDAREIILTFTPETIEPNEITMKAGEKILFVITNTDDEGEHNFLSAEAELPEILVNPEATVKRVWTAPTTPGTYGAMCTIHPWIKMTFVVE